MALPLARIVLATLLLVTAATAQTTDDRPSRRTSAEPAPSTRPASRPSPVLVTATRSEKDSFDVPHSTDVITNEDIERRRLSRTLPEALKETPGVSVQKTGHGQGSPKIRGQTGFHTLFLIDGIRLNNSTWRSGNVEYWNTVDPYSLERLELVRGPSSVLWGSDAVSGTGHGIVKERTSFADGLHANHRLLFRYASAENSFVERLDTEGNLGRSFGWHAGFSYKDFGHLNGGKEIGEMGLTGYQEVDGDVKLTFPLAGRDRIVAGFQHVGQGDAPRTHSTTASKSWRGSAVGTDFLRDIDQQRDLVYAQYLARDPSSWYDELDLSVSWHDFHEDENRMPANSRRTIQGVDVTTLGLFARAVKETSFGRLTFGADWYHDEVDSFFREYNPDGSVRAIRGRGPVADDSSYDLLGVYVQDEAALSRTFELVAGARYSYAAADADDVNVPGGSFGPIDESWSSVVGSVRLLAKPCDDWRVYTGVSQSFRAPNLSDLTRFDVARSGEQEVPAPNLDPEEYLTFEVGVRHDNRDFGGELTWYYTDVNDQIRRFPTGNSVGGLPEVTKGNVGDGWFTGIEASGRLGLACLGAPAWEVRGYADWVGGRITSVVSPGVTEEHHPDVMPPASGFLALRWNDPRRDTWFELFTSMAYHQHRLTAADRADPQRIPPGGLPGYAVFGVRGSTDVCENLRASLAVENIADRDYRIMGSGLNEPGTNVIMTLEARF